ncbi:MAG: methionine gamma-lyase family protein [Clostridia bacterium]|nr:methionine gamma-lyase family protein [Clostridia bacterium]
MFSEKLLTIAAEAEVALKPIFEKIDKISFDNTSRVLDAFKENRVADSMFAGTTGYGYDDVGRDTLDKIYAQVMGAESAFVRHSIVNGTQALTIGLFGLLRPNDVMLSVTNRPYDTLCEVVGIEGTDGNGSLKDFGVQYEQVDFKNKTEIDFDGIEEKLNEFGERVKVVFIQRSKGYLDRPTLTVDQIGEIAQFVHARSKAYVVVDNCYGEFTETKEPCMVGADMVIGSLIKNPGGGIAESGGYIAGTARAVELASYRLTSVGTGTEVGATLGQNRNLFKGFFLAPHIVAQAQKTAHFAAYVLEKLGFDVNPKYDEMRSDIIQTVKFGYADGLVKFCQGIQSASPVDSYVVPVPWAMPGYNDEVIMAAGAFTQGSSIELSADGPLREPYIAFFQGSLTYESGKIAILTAAEKLLDNSNAQY